MLIAAPTPCPQVGSGTIGRHLLGCMLLQNRAAGSQNVRGGLPQELEEKLEWHTLQPAGVGPCESQNPQAEACATYPTIEIIFRMWRPTASSPVTCTCVLASSNAIPFVKMRQAISCGIVVSEIFSPAGEATKAHASPSRKRNQLPPHSPEMLNCARDPGLAATFR